MKYCISVLCILLLSNSCKQEANIEPSISTSQAPSLVNWKSIEKATQLATKEAKDVFVFFYTPWCPKCENLKKTTFVDPQVVEVLNTHFVPVMFNAQESKSVSWNGKNFANPNYDHAKSSNDKNSYHELCFELGAEAIPSMIVLDASLNNLSTILGYKDSNRLLWSLADATGRFDYKLKR